MHRDGADEDVRQEFPETETMRHAVPDSSLENFPPGSDDGMDVNMPLRSDEVINEKEVVSTSREDPLASGGSIPPRQQHSPPAASSDAPEAAASFHEDAAFGGYYIFNYLFMCLYPVIVIHLMCTLIF